MTYHPVAEKIVDHLCSVTQNTDKHFFRVMVTYSFSIMAAQMRASIVGLNSDKPIPINSYIINLAPSGAGKGYSTSFLEKPLLEKFKNRFTRITMPVLADEHMQKLARNRAARNNTMLNDEMEGIKKDYANIGSYLFSFDSATTPALKQQRYKLLMANSGSLNFTMDEIGANLGSNEEVLNAFLELYDLGHIREKLIKSTADNKRLEAMEGTTPSNMLMFGTPTKLLDGGRTEELFMSFLDQGYARRCLFGFTRHTKRNAAKDVDDLIEQLLDETSSSFMNDLADTFGSLADYSNAHQNIVLDKPELRILMSYRLKNEEKALTFAEHDSLRKTELEHRHFKAVKIAGSYAFVDRSPKITKEHLTHAITLVEDSGRAFDALVTSERSYEKLARYLADVKHECTLADLITELPYFKGSKQQKDEMLQLAVAWGSRNNIIVKKTYLDDILLLKGESLEETFLDDIHISLSDHAAYNYNPMSIEWDDLQDLATDDNYHWCNHAFTDNHRKEVNTIPGFNLIVLDVDSGYPLSAAVTALQGFKAFIYTTKSHTPENNRYRILLPTNYILDLDKEEYKDFMNNIISTMPFTVDECSNQRSKKWLTSNGHFEFLEGKLFDVLPYIPKTKRNEERQINMSKDDLSRLESWVINNSGDGNRNNQLYKYACILKQQGDDFASIRKRVLQLNEGLSDRLTEEEITNTIFKSIINK